MPAPARACWSITSAGARPPGYANQPKSHNAVAAAIAQNRADWGLAIEPVAKLYGLGFVPVAPEHYDFLLVEKRKDRPAVQAFLAALKDETTRARIAALGMQPAGYRNGPHHPQCAAGRRPERAARYRHRRRAHRRDRAQYFRRGQSLRRQRPARLSRSDREPHPSRQVAHHRPLRAAGAQDAQPRVRRHPGQEGHDGRGRARARQRDARRMHQARHHAHAHAGRGRSRHRHARLRRRRSADRRIQMGDRHRDVRLPAGRPDQLSRHRRIAGRRLETRRQSDRRRAALRQRRARADPSHLRTGARVRSSISTCISTSAPPPTTCISIWCAN